jgi:hypothetical protein
MAQAAPSAFMAEIQMIIHNAAQRAAPVNIRPLRPFLLQWIEQAHRERYFDQMQDAEETWRAMYEGFLVADPVVFGEMFGILVGGGVALSYASVAIGSIAAGFAALADGIASMRGRDERVIRWPGVLVISIERGASLSDDPSIPRRMSLLEGSDAIDFQLVSIELWHHEMRHYTAWVDPDPDGWTWTEFNDSRGSR